jgi:hypothetical protein
VSRTAARIERGSPGNEYTTNSLRIAYARARYHFSVMVMVVFLMRVLEVAFFVGMAGSAIVVLISFIEDFGVLIHRDQDET